MFSNYSAIVLAQAPAPASQPAAPQGGMGGMGMIIYFVCFGVIFYFMLIRPQKKKQQEHNKLMAAIKAGDDVITSSGMHARVHSVKDNSIVLRVADNVRIEFDKSAIATISKPTGSTEIAKA